MAMVCPRCQALIRHGDRVKAVVHAVFERVDTESHHLYAYFEEVVQHIACDKPSTLKKLYVWLLRLAKRPVL